MPRDRSLREWVVGKRTRHRFVYLLAASGIAVGVGVLPDGWVSASIWLFGGLGVGIGAVAGACNYGLLPGVIATALYVAMVGQAAFLATPMPPDLAILVTRVSLVLLVATLALLIPSYLLGVGVRFVARRRR